jgi:hypothetical protein
MVASIHDQYFQTELHSFTMSQGILERPSYRDVLNPLRKKSEERNDILLPVLVTNALDSVPYNS